MLRMGEAAIGGTAKHRKNSKVLSSRRCPSPSKTIIITLQSFNGDCTKCLSCFDAVERRHFPMKRRHRAKILGCSFYFTFNASCSQKYVVKSQPPWIWLPLYSQQFNFPALLFCGEAESSGVMLIESVWSIQINLVWRNKSGLPGK